MPPRSECLGLQVLRSTSPRWWCYVGKQYILPHFTPWKSLCNKESIANVKELNYSSLPLSVLGRVHTQKQPKWSVNEIMLLLLSISLSGLEVDFFSSGQSSLKIIGFRQENNFFFLFNLNNRVFQVCLMKTRVDDLTQSNTSFCTKRNSKIT